MISALLKNVKRRNDADAEFKAELITLRKDMAKLTRQREDVEAAPVPKAEALTAVSHWLDELEERHMPSPGAFTTGHVGDRPSLKTADGSPLAGLFAAACRELILKTLDDHLDDYYENRPSLSSEQKRQQLAKLDADILRLARLEESAIREAEAAGLPIRRREDAEPAIVLLTDEALRHGL